MNDHRQRNSREALLHHLAVKHRLQLVVEHEAVEEQEAGEGDKFGVVEVDRRRRQGDCGLFFNMVYDLHRSFQTRHRQHVRTANMNLSACTDICQVNTSIDIRNV